MQFVRPVMLLGVHQVCNKLLPNEVNGVCKIPPMSVKVHWKIDYETDEQPSVGMHIAKMVVYTAAQVLEGSPHYYEVSKVV